jgi:murein DD-endopeptidase MepM/ murein hydrolase activator NlpD
MRKLLVLLVALVLVFAGAYVWAGRAAGPAIHITKPGKLVGTSTPLEVTVESPGGALTELHVFFEQNGAQTPLVVAGRNVTWQAPADYHSTNDGPDKLTVSRTLSRDSVPALASGTARILVTAARPVFFGLRQARSQAALDVQVRLERPKVSVLSTKHYINLGGSEMLVYRATPADVSSGVKVGDIEYPGFPAAGVTVDGLSISDPAVHVAFFALLYDQDVNAPMHVYARDEAGNEARAEFDHRSFPKAFKKSRIEVNDQFLDRVVPAILQSTTEIKPDGTTIDKFLAINGDLRRKNAVKIASFAPQTSHDLLWKGVVFHAFANTKVEAAFADFRTYVYQGREVDKQVHLGFDLASFAGASIVAANRGKVVFADELGIYGNCVIIDHGMGVQSLYAHLSSIGVKPGDMVEKDQQIGRSGMTGLAAGDHLHFTMLVNGHPVNPIEWWDPHWIQDRVIRKLKDAR